MDDTHRFLLGKFRCSLISAALDPIPILYALEDVHELRHYDVLRILEEDTKVGQFERLLDLLSSRGILEYGVFKEALRTQSVELFEILSREEQFYKLEFCS